MEYKVGFIGDIHGHFVELKALVKKLEKYGVSRIISIGDLVDRGPKPHECIEFIRTHKFKTNTGELRPLEMVLGNHEDSHMRIKLGKPYPGKIEVYKTSRNPKTFDRITDDDWEFLKVVPYVIHDEQIGVTALHGGVTPEMESLTGLTFDEFGLMSRVNYLPIENGKGTFWTDRYDGRFGHIVYGHTSFDKIDRTEFATGIDGEKKGKFNAVVFSSKGEEKSFTIKATPFFSDLGFSGEAHYFGGSSLKSGVRWDDFFYEGKTTAVRVEEKKGTKPRKSPSWSDDTFDCFNTQRLTNSGNGFDIESQARYCGCSGCEEFLSRKF